MSENTDREAFESWCVPLGFDDIRLAEWHCCTYFDNDTENAFMGWNAGLAHKKNESTATTAEALEKAAKIAEKFEPDEKQSYINYASKEIRALIKE